MVTPEGAKLSEESEVQVGLELEFLAPHDTAWEEKHLRDVEMSALQSIPYDACHYHLARCLHEAGLLSACKMLSCIDAARHPFLADAEPGSLITSDTRTRTFANPSPIDLADGEASLFGFWVIKPEAHLTDRPRYMKWIECELNTPILAEHDLLRARGGASFEHVDIALATLHKGFDGTAPHISSMCGLHVHLSPVIGCNPIFIRRVVTLALVLDRPLLFPLCNPARLQQVSPIMSSSELKQLEAKLPEEPVTAEVELPEALVAEEGRVLAEIWNGNLKRLSQMTERVRERTTASIMIKSQPDRHRPQRNVLTIEFRHAQASFRPSFVRAWTKLILAISRVSLRCRADYNAALVKLWEARKRSGSGDDEGAVCFAMLRVLSEEAMLGGMPEPLDEEFWRERYSEMKAGRDPDVDEYGKARVD